MAISKNKPYALAAAINVFGMAPNEIPNEIMVIIPTITKTATITEYNNKFDLIDVLNLSPNVNSPVVAYVCKIG